uniref:ABC transporter ATP-binding protein n=1 Tax=Pristionchus pacificus TaxID=54126 RepID=A0A8R1YJA7_PRIPA
MKPEEDRLHEEEEDEVYPRLHSQKRGMSEDLSVRYSSGASREKTLARYSSTLRSMVPMSGGTKAQGSAKVDEAGILSFVTYHWVFEYLWKAFRGRLSSDEDWQCSIYDASDVNMARMQVLWDAERSAARTANRPPKLIKAVAAFVKTRVYIACAVFLFCLIFGFIGPTCFVRGLVGFAEEPGEHSNYTYAFFLVFGLLFVEVARVLSYGATWAISYRTGIRLRGALLGLLYKHALGVKSQKKTPAEIVNMFANDGQRIFDAITFTPLVLIGPLVLVGGIIYLMIVIGPWALVGILVFFLFDVIQYGLGKTMVRCRNEAIKKTEERMSLMGELLRCIRAIKMNGWERAFLDRVQVLRHNEKVSLRKAGYAQSMAIASGPVVPVVAAILTFLGVVLSGNDLLASDAFSAVTVFFVMLFGIRMIPYGSRYLAEAVVALRRIQEVLESSQWEGPAPTPSNPVTAIKMKNATFAWTNQGAETPSNDESAPADVSDHFLLKEVNLVVQKKELVGICGPVGAGKTALLTSIIGHMYPCEGEVEVGGSVALVPQVPWIQNATVQENILFGQPMNSKKYYKAISASQLTKDLEAMPANELTEIGERGATLSGGQKARVALARALFSTAEVLLLDDVLSACDAKVADRIFNDAVLGVLRGKTVLMVTNDVNRLSRCDRVLLMEGGRIVVSGTHSELLTLSDQYSTYCHDASQRYTLEGDSVVVGVSKEVDKPRPDRVASPTDLEFDHLDETNPIVDTEKVELVGLDKGETAKGKLVADEEDFGSASVAFDVYMKYVRAAGGVLIWSLLLFAFLFNVVASIFAPFWLSQWLKHGHDEHMETVNGSEMLVSSDSSLSDSPHTSYYASIYGISLVLLFVSGLLKAMLFVKVSLNAASRLHNNMLNAIVAGSASFFDSTPSGRLLNRFSKDVDEIDVKMPFTVEVFLQNMLTCIGFLLVIGWVLPHFVLLSIPLFAVFILFVLCFRAGIRLMKRSENISRSPLFAHVTTSLEGIQVIHSHDQSIRFLDNMKRRLDSNSAAMFVFQSAMRWLAVWLDLLVVGITFIVALLIVLLTGKISPSDAGMALAFAIQMSGIFQFAVRTQTELEAKMTSVERVAYYTDNVAKEGSWDTRPGVQIPADWPARGQIDFLNVNLRYQPTLPLALSDVSFTVNAGEKVAIIGRTGSGKSSLGNALFRLYALANGKIAIDGVDISTVGLHRLRRSLAVIPQDPVLFAGTIRYNLDPLGQYADHQLWTALEKANLRAMVSNMGKQLDAEVTAGGDNLSVGERQLLCMARALLIKAKVVLLDEATASLDAATDRLIWQCISTQFENATVLVVAHRLNHVHLMSRIIMMDAGKVVEFDEPNVVLNSGSSPTGSEIKVEPAIGEGATPATKRDESPAEETEDSDAELVSEAKISSISDEDEEDDPEEK